MRHVRLMQAIDKVARMGSIRRAAEVIAISPSALNRQILAVEEDVGAELFERMPRGVRLSTAGEIYLRCFRAHLAELDRAASQVADLSGLRAGAIRLGVTEELADHFAPSVVAAYQAQYPMVDIAMRVTPMDQLGPALRAFDIDIGLAVNCLQDETVETIHAEPVEVVCIASSASDLPDPISLSDLAGRPLFAPSEGSGLRNAVDALLSFRNIPRRYALETDRLAPGMLRANPVAAQFAIGLNIEPKQMADQDLSMHVLPSTAPLATVSLLGLRYRALPVSSAKLASEFAKALSAG